MDVKEILNGMSVQELMGAYRVLSAVHYSDDLFHTISGVMDDIMRETDVKLEQVRVESDKALEEANKALEEANKALEEIARIQRVHA